MDMIKTLTVLTVLAFASAGAAFAQNSSSTISPNCSPGQQGCFANSATSDVSSANPTKAPYDAKGSPNCSPGTLGCSANSATSDVSKTMPASPQK